MPEAIQFYCPACGITLRVPLAASGTQGPCPRCQQSIICPDLATGIGARRAGVPFSAPAAQASAEPPRPSRDADPFNPFSRKPEPLVSPPAPQPVSQPAPEPAPEPQPAPLPEPHPEPPPVPAPAPQPAPQSEPEPTPQLPPPPQPIPQPEPQPAPQPIPQPLPQAEPPAPAEPAPAFTFERVKQPPPIQQSRPEPFSGVKSPELPRTEAPVAEDPPVRRSGSSRKQRRDARAEAAEERSSASVGARALMILLLLFSLLAALVGFIAGYGFGARNVPIVNWFQPPPEKTDFLPGTNRAPSQPVTPEPETDRDPETQPVPPPPSSTEEIPPPPPTTEPPAGEDPAERPQEEPPSLKVISAPEAALKAFLSAPDWRTRAKHVLYPARTTEKMEAYHIDTPDGPTVPTQITLAASHDDPDTGERLFTYMVATEAHPRGFPVAIMKTPDGWKVDWDSFVEFRDDHFRRFASGEGSDTGTFHLLVRNTHHFGDKFPGSDKLSVFRVDPPLLDRDQYAFAPTGKDLQKALTASIEWGRPCAAVLQLTRKKNPDGTTRLEITNLVAPNWRPRP
ncbi:hypothetical protein OKA04_09675 [Luteolibacter flavescens]|uniref:Uncharacterized protein n=1 Tax=Luteolibacter flavescens TaxID=1859460 RepID=A0ABT3FPS9_9BACT|nr:hypothetical protein [Luteolibacter flavescens]MCW1884995.1 hypothetical protein [Luteolibacter flavescens]